MLVGDINKTKNQIEFIKLDNRIFVEKNLDITEINSQEELAQKMNSIVFEPNTENKIILEGKRNFEININNLFKLIQNNQIIKIKNNTKIKYNLEEISKENNLRGIYVKKLLEKINTENYTEEEILKAIEIGLDIL